MPFESKAQRGFMFAKHPEIAKRWAKETPKDAKLPEHKADTKRTAHAMVEAHKKGLVKT